MGDLSPHFSSSELRCPDGCGQFVISPFLVDLLERAREELDRPIVITSGFRCVKHNTEVGGKPNSAHLTGEAADIACYSDATRWELLNIFFALGVKRIEVGPTWLHVDVAGPPKPQGVVFFP